MAQAQTGIKFGKDPSPVISKRCPNCHALLMEMQIYDLPYAKFSDATKVEAKNLEFGQIRTKCRKCKREVTFALVN